MGWWDSPAFVMAEPVLLPFTLNLGVGWGSSSTFPHRQRVTAVFWGSILRCAIQLEGGENKMAVKSHENLSKVVQRRQLHHGAVRGGCDKGNCVKPSSFLREPVPLTS